MYEKKMPFNIDCCIKVTMEVIGGKWKCCIVDALKDGPKRPSEIQKHFPEANARVISQQLKELEMHGIIEKKDFRRTASTFRIFADRNGKDFIADYQQIGGLG